MAKSPVKPGKSVEARARQLRDRFAESGFTSIEPPILQPADAFIDLSGENIRRRLFVVQGTAGEELCLRPDLTIPVARIHLQTRPGQAARYCYSGPSFRRAINGDPDNPGGEFYQAGIEAFGHSETETDMEVLDLAISSLKNEGLDRLHLQLGDPGLFRAVIENLDIPEFWRARLLRHFWRHDLSEGLEAALTQSPQVSDGREALAAALSALDRKAGSQLVGEVLALAGIEPVGGRKAEEIASRFMERAAMNAAPLPDSAIDIVRSYLRIEGAPHEAFAAIRTLIDKAKLDLGSHLARLEEQIKAAEAAMRDAGNDPESVRFDTKFGRNLEYYSGFVFEISDPRRPELRQIAGGGRYDRLMTGLGAKQAIAATGCAIYVDRLIAATEQTK